MTPTAAPDHGLMPAEEREYRPFPNEEGRNSRQETLEVPILVRALRLPKRARILEIGCGRGIALLPLARLLEPARLTGLDIEPRLLAEARARLDAAGVEAELVPGDARALPFPAAAFDLVIDFGTCYHIARAGDALREVARVLAPGGKFVHETPLSQLLSHPVRSLGRRIPWRSEPRLGQPRQAILWSARSLAGAS
ncbi:MAG TPA: class I SAM-dependent methyltransferase [Gemmatimonadales bacterium]|nr:class I SAM-dependent methyltransferase [Gemmatimonadales bacterium]